ncbi:MAG: aminopeptidase P family N-terminal domain-containing protein [Hungatella hathewayi]|uniref:aminopeptidase P family N-terminal domain-containing protein n=1 Tax=Hungatella TaxID=1649459 RepID=UPI001FACDA68|nr:MULTISPECIES: aminopeptidase P family N-terminal domain-containing protein [Hungatella]MCI7384270.1 aminopeptidase P family N-terminal domain-containing protein [Hungatella sp.]MDY6239338.1 aminopeptidase P family N-terminal domain-containing protein [Hungatella hathewayi]
MKNFEFHNRVIHDVTEILKELDIDLYLIITSEGSDKMTRFIPGVDTVGSGAFFFTKEGKRYGVASTIDAQDVEESGLFDEVVRYQDYESAVAGLLERLNPKRVALDFSETDAECDGLTLGRYEHYKSHIKGQMEYTEVSSDLFIPQVKAAVHQ